MPTDEEIRIEISKLEHFKFRVRQTDGFGGSNRAKIEAGIRTLQTRKDPCDQAEFQGLSSEEAEDGEGYDIDEFNSAKDTFDWLTGSKETPPSEEWRQLLVTG